MPDQESEQSCSCVLGGVDFACFYDFGIVVFFVTNFIVLICTCEYHKNEIGLQQKWVKYDFPLVI